MLPFPSLYRSVPNVNDVVRISPYGKLQVGHEVQLSHLSSGLQGGSKQTQEEAGMAVPPATQHLRVGGGRVTVSLRLA